MHSILNFIPIAALLAASASAYDSNCDGSFVPITREDCNDAIANIDTAQSYSDGHEFSAGTCYIVYATNGSGPQTIEGQRILDTVNRILDVCQPNGHGSYGTGNCDQCHVTVNYRKAP